MLDRRAFLLCSGLLALGACRNSGSQDTAWHRLEVALDSNNDLEVIRASEVFLTTPRTPDAEPSRTLQVQRAYQQAFVRWLLALPGKPEVDALQHIQKFQSLMSAIPSQGEQP
jgi:hypothetical protein